MSWEEHPPVVGIDTNSYGFHLTSTRAIVTPNAVDLGDDLMLPYGWAISVAKDAQDRRHDTFRRARQFFSSLPGGSTVWVEEPLVLPKNIETTRKLVMTGGVIEAAFFDAKPDASLFWVDIATWRKHILGKGSGRKDEMKELAKKWVQEHSDAANPSGKPWDLTPIAAVYEQEPDLYDAHCVMAYGQKMIASGLVRVP